MRSLSLQILSLFGTSKLRMRADIANPPWRMLSSGVLWAKVSSGSRVRSIRECGPPSLLALRSFFYSVLCAVDAGT